MSLYIFIKHMKIFLAQFSDQEKHFFFSLILIFFFLIDLYWSIIASQYCVSFYCTTEGIGHTHTHVPISPPSWASLPSSLSHLSRSSQSTEPISLCYAAASHQPTILHSVVYTCQCYSHFAPASPSHPTSWSPFSTSTSLLAWVCLCR